MEGKKIVDEFFNMFKELQTKSTEADKMQGVLDRELSDIYHKIEGAKTKHISEGWRLFKELQDILQRRRQVKYDAIILRSLVDNLGEKMEHTIKRSIEVTGKHNGIMKQFEDKRE